MAIPKLIHQTFSSWSRLPPELVANAHSIRSMNADYEYCFYDDLDIVEFIRNNFESGVLSAYQRINPKYGAARADLFRYLCLYILGGVYLDVKTEVARPLSAVLQSSDEYILSQWDQKRFPKWGLNQSLAHVRGGEFQQWYMIAAPGHPFLKAVIDRVISSINRYNPFVDGTGPASVIRVTGPVAYTLAIEPLRRIYPHRFVDSKSDLGLDYSIYAASGDHFRAYSTHYTQLTDPLVMVNAPLRTFFLAARSAKRLGRRLVRSQRGGLPTDG